MTVKTVDLAKIPDHLIYEMDEGQPIYYKGYKDYFNLNGTKQNEETMPDSSLQAWLKIHLSALLIAMLLKNPSYVVTGGEQGLSLKKKSWRGADVAIFHRKNFILDNKYSKKPPEIVIEINIKGDFSSNDKIHEYFERKNSQLLEFGVKKIIWLFTETEFIMSLTKDGEEHFKWNDDIPVMEGVSFNVQKLIDKFNEYKE